jgi:hypothetical protein
VSRTNARSKEAGPTEMDEADEHRESATPVPNDARRNHEAAHTTGGYSSREG